MMLGVGRLPPPSATPLPLKKPTLSFSLFFHHQIHKANLRILRESMSNYSSLSRRTGFCLFAQKKGKHSSFSDIKMEEKEEIDEEEDGFEFYEDVVFDDEEEDLDVDDGEEDGDVMVPFNKMNDWVVKKPKGFGEGKVYDTSLEDKMLEEIEKNAEAQFAIINKLKNEPKKPKSELQEDLFNASEGVPGGIRVRLNNLPKKRNIHRDLKSAFEGIPGIIDILPVNSGNKKTRDPVCKGLAYVDFKSLKDANSFVQMFSDQNIAFGKSDKPIKCEILKPLDACDDGSSYDGYSSTSEGTFTVLEDDDDDDDVDDDDDDDDDDKLFEVAERKYVLGNSEKLSANDRLKRIEMLEAKLLARATLYEKELKAFKMEPEVKNKSDKKPNQKTDKKFNQKTDKKPNQKFDKKPKPSNPGSAKKLKVREKAKLADAFSRYGSKQASG